MKAADFSEIIVDVLTDIQPVECAPDNIRPHLEWIRNRYTELKRTIHYPEAARQAKLAWIKQLLGGI